MLYFLSPDDSSNPSTMVDTECDKRDKRDNMTNLENVTNVTNVTNMLKS